MTLLLYAAVGTALWYLGSRALITQAIWMRYPQRLATFMDCPACTGFWWGLILALAGRYTELVPDAGLHPILAGLASIFLVAVGAGILTRALTEAGTAVAQAEEDTWYEPPQ